MRPKNILCLFVVYLPVMTVYVIRDPKIMQVGVLRINETANGRLKYNSCMGI